MGADHRHLVGIEPTGLEQDAVGDRDLADVMQRRGEIDVAAQARRKAELLGDDAAISGDPQRMLAGARALDGAGAAGLMSALAAADEANLDSLFARYTMERERDVHRDFLRSFGVTPKEPEKAAVPADADDGLELF
jgi:hypothetical protein